MAISISASVGDGGENKPKDVLIVYSLFNKILAKPIKANDVPSDELIKAIKNFQKNFRLFGILRYNDI